MLIQAAKSFLPMAILYRLERQKGYAKLYWDGGPFFQPVLLDQVTPPSFAGQLPVIIKKNFPFNGISEYSDATKLRLGPGR
jgi:hypothetical protein